jgi:hypothetical protein
MDENLFSSKIWMKSLKWVEKRKKNIGRFGWVLNLHPKFQKLKKLKKKENPN